MLLALAGGPFFDKRIAARLRGSGRIAGGVRRKHSDIAPAMWRPYIRRMNDPDQNKLGFLIHDVARLMNKRFLARDNEFGLTSAQWRLLFNLLKEDGVSQARLAELLEVQPISVSRMVDRLAQDGWVARRLSQTDRRVRMIYATRKAREACSGIREISASVHEEALSGLDEKDRRILMDVLGKVALNLYGSAAEMPGAIAPCGTPDSQSGAPA